MSRSALTSLAGVVVVCVASLATVAQQPRDPPARQPPKRIPNTLPTEDEQRAPERARQLSEHDRSTAFKADEAPDSSNVLKSQPEAGRVEGFDFFRDPLNAKEPKQSPRDIMRQIRSASAPLRRATSPQGHSASGAR